MAKIKEDAIIGRHNPNVIEFLMIYAWAILIILIILFVFIYLGVIK